MKTFDYFDAVYGRSDFIATDENLLHYAMCEINAELQSHTSQLVYAREKYKEAPTNANVQYIDICRRKLQVSCQQARMMITASRAERFGYTECTMNATQEDIERYLDLLDDMRVPHHETCLCAGCAASIEYV